MIIDKKRHAGLQAYKVKKNDDYLIVDRNSYFFGTDGVMFSAIATVNGDINSGLCGTNISNEYLVKDCHPVSWKKIPDKWKSAFRSYLEL